MKKEDAFYIGYITKTKGLKGEVQLYFEFENYEILDLDVIFMDINAKMVPFFSKSHKLYPNNTGLFYFEDIDHIDKAQPLIKKKVFLPLTKMPEPDEDDFSYGDLKGFMVIDDSFGELGEVILVQEYPQQFVATVLHKDKEIMFPLNEELILDIDIDKKAMSVDLPEGLIELYINS